MRITDPFGTRQRIADLSHQLEKQQVQNTRLFGQVAELVKIVNNFNEEDESTGYAGNRYRTYEKQAYEIDRKYNATSKWGVVQLGNIVDFRAAMIVGSGLRLKVKDPSNKESVRALEFSKAMVRWNNLDREGLQELAKEGELEGKILNKLFFVPRKDKDDPSLIGQDGTVFPGMVAVRHIPWVGNKYTIDTDPSDYLEYIRATYTPTGGAPTTIEASRFVYGRFGGRVSRPNETTPKVAKCLSQIEDLDRALRDWRAINFLFASPIPHAECADVRTAREMQEDFDKRNYKIGKMFFHVGKFDYASPTMEGVAALEKEIITLAKMISGCTGVPVHFLGLPDLMSNRATADNLFELVTASTQKERETWKGLLEEIVDKAIETYNEGSQQTPIKTGLVDVDLPFISSQQWDQLINVWLPLYNANAIALETLLRRVPDLDVEDELAKKAAADASEFQRMKDEMAQRDNGDAEQGAKNNGTQK